MLIGAHVSVSGGLTKAVDYARSVGCECMQFFAKSPRQWKASEINRENAAAFKAAREDVGFGPVFTHTAYLINLSTADDALRDKSVAALADELERGAVLGADAVVTHIGNDKAGDAEAAAKRVGAALNEAFEIAERGFGTTRLLLENSAGAGSIFGATFEQIASCISESGLASEHLGICLDTCHGFAQGMELDSVTGWHDCLDSIEACCGSGRLGLVHGNDCMFERGSRRDRHAWIGEGFIGEEGFRAMMCMPQLRGVPLVTEMPGEVPAKDIINIERLKSFRERCAGSQTT
jgi:deoxyribonuclease IV